MARIPNIELDRIKREVSLVRLAESSSIELKKHGKDYLGLCPFHDDKEPSLVISPEKNLWHCLGACNQGGDVIQWVMKRQGVSFRHAVALLREDDATLAAPASKPVKRNTSCKHASSLAADPDDQAQLNRVIDYYHETLKNSPEALVYLDKRGLNDPALIERFKLGFANRTLAYRLPEKDRKAGASVRGQLQRVGIIRSSGHEHFNGSIVVPVFDEMGNVLEIYGRKVTRNLRKGTPQHLYLPGPHQGVFNLEALKNAKEIILCESLIDALTFWAAGYHNVTASYGISGFTDDHLKAFKHHETERVLIAYDRDEAGEQASTMLAKQLIAEGIDCYRIQFPKGMDANEYALQVTPAVKSLGVVIRSAVWLGKGRRPALNAEPTTSAATECPAKKVSDPLPSLAAEEQATLDPPEPQPEQCLPATPVPEPPQLDIAAGVTDNEVTMTFGNRRWRIRGLDKNLSFDLLKVNLLASQGEAFHVDTLDLYQARPRAGYIKQAAIELGLKEEVIKRDLGKVLLKLESLQEERINQAMESKDETVSLSNEEREAALALLKSPDLMNRILTDFEACGVVGEQTNKLVGYLAACSRKLDAPLAVIVQSASAAGKSSLMDAVLNLMPEEERVQYSAMTGQSLFYMGESNLKNKILAIVEEEGAERASYALKLLQSEGELTIASTGKDPQSGRLETQEYHVEGPVMIFLTTTAIEIDDELLNRCLVLTVDEDREQTQAIHALQRKKRTLEGLQLKQDKQRVLKLHRNAQRLLRPLAIVNPYAEQLTFLDDKTRTRRDHEKYLTLIDTIALLYQYQRQIKCIRDGEQVIEYIEVTLEDIEAANHLAHEVLGRTLDELPPQTRRLLDLVHKMVLERCKSLDMHRSDYRFSRREISVYTGWSYDQVRIHVARLIDMEHILVHRGGRGQSFVYELLYDGSEHTGIPHLNGLIEVDQLHGSTGTTKTLEGKRAGVGGALEGQLIPNGASLEMAENAASPSLIRVAEEIDEEPEKKPYRGAMKEMQKSGVIAPTSLAAKAG